MDGREFIKSTCYRMKVGQEIQVCDQLFAKSFPWGWPTMYRSPEESFLSGMIGSAWGTWRVRKDYPNDTFIISRHKESNKRYYVEADREHLFKQLPDGTWESRLNE